MSDVSVASPSLAQSAENRPLSVRDALRKAWAAYIVLLVFPFVVFMAVLAYLSTGSGPATSSGALGQVWFVAALLWMGLAVPVSFFVRARIFRDYWMGKVVEPRDYLRGMLTVWGTIEIGGIFALVGCAVSGAVIPCILPAMVAFMLFCPFWPSGDAMVSPVGAEDDSELFRHPR